MLAIDVLDSTKYAVAGLLTTCLGVGLFTAWRRTKNHAWAILLAIGLLASGCASSPQTPLPEPYVFVPPTPGVVIPGNTNVIRRCLVVALTRVDPDHWNGWEGACPGADLDAWAQAEMRRAVGTPVVVLMNEQATIANVEAALRKLSAGMRDGDLLDIVYSGHGGRRRDLGGDESDGYDETMCLYDGEWLDDRSGSLLDEVTVRLRVYFTTDSCHSDTHYRSTVSRRIKRSLGSFPGEFLHIGACQDDDVAMGSASDGGVLTSAQFMAFNPEQSYWTHWLETNRRKAPGAMQRFTIQAINVSQEFWNTEVLR